MQRHHFIFTEEWSQKAMRNLFFIQTFNNKDITKFTSLCLQPHYIVPVTRCFKISPTSKIQGNFTIWGKAGNSRVCCLVLIFCPKSTVLFFKENILLQFHAIPYWIIYYVYHIMLAALFKYISILLVGEWRINISLALLLLSSCALSLYTRVKDVS